MIRDGEWNDIISLKHDLCTGRETQGFKAEGTHSSIQLTENPRRGAVLWLRGQTITYVRKHWKTVDHRYTKYRWCFLKTSNLNNRHLPWVFSSPHSLQLVSWARIPKNPTTGSKSVQFFLNSLTNRTGRPDSFGSIDTLTAGQRLYSHKQTHSGLLVGWLRQNKELTYWPGTDTVYIDWWQLSDASITVLTADANLQHPSPEGLWERAPSRPFFQSIITIVSP